MLFASTKSSFVYHKNKLKLMINNDSRYFSWRATSLPAAEVISVILILPLHEKEYSLRKVSSLAYNKSNTVKAGV